MSAKKSTPKKSARPSGNGGSGSPMDVSLLERMVKLMAAHDLNTVDVRDGERRVVLKRGVAATMTYAPAPAAAAPTAAPAPVPASPAMPPAVSAAEAEEANFLPIKSPMVGTFYAAPSKGAKPFVTVGTKVDEESDVCIVEAMKVFNNIKAECSGTIARILVNDSQPVEFGQVLFLVKPN
jgi:acetyl-CoA carboxylase biotin carboxyl carrier protein